MTPRSARVRGSLFSGGNRWRYWVKSAKSADSVAPDEWFTMRVIAQGIELTRRCNGCELRQCAEQVPCAVTSPANLGSDKPRPVPQDRDQGAAGEFATAQVPGESRLALQRSRFLCRRSVLETGYQIGPDHRRGLGLSGRRQRKRCRRRRRRRGRCQLSRSGRHRETGSSTHRHPTPGTSASAMNRLRQGNMCIWRVPSTGNGFATLSTGK